MNESMNEWMNHQGRIKTLAFPWGKAKEKTVGPTTKKKDRKKIDPTIIFSFFTNHIGQEIQCLPYAEFLLLYSLVHIQISIFLSKYYRHYLPHSR